MLNLVMDHLKVVFTTTQPPLRAVFWGCCSPLCPSSQTQNITVKKYLSRCWGSGSSGTQVHHQLSNHSSSGSHWVSSQRPPRMALSPNLRFTCNSRWKWGTGRIPPQFPSSLTPGAVFPEQAGTRPKSEDFACTPGCSTGVPWLGELVWSCRAAPFLPQAASPCL